VSPEAPAHALAASHAQRRVHHRAIGLVALATACFAGMDTLAKYAGTLAPLPQVLWVRYAVQAAVMTLWWAVLLRPASGWGFFRTRQLRWHLLRGGLLLACTAVAFMGLRHMPVGEFTAVAFLAPMIAMVLSAWLLKEYVAPAHWALAVVAFCGALIVIRPGAGIFGWAVWLAIALAVLNSLFQLVTRKLASQGEHPVLSQWIAGWVGVVGLLLPMAWPGTWQQDLGWWPWAVMLSIGALGAIGHFFLMEGFALDTAPALAPYSYMQIIFAMLAGWLAFAHAPDGWAVVGMLVIGGSGFASAWLRARHRAPPR
jgi:drug/metabolite transporter (DMT)-like permease